MQPKEKSLTFFDMEDHYKEILTGAGLISDDKDLDDQILKDFHIYSLQMSGYLWSACRFTEILIRNTLHKILRDHYDKVALSNASDGTEQGDIIPWWLLVFFVDADNGHYSTLLNKVGDIADELFSCDHLPPYEPFPENKELSINQILRSMSLGNWTKATGLESGDKIRPSIKGMQKICESYFDNRNINLTELKFEIAKFTHFRNDLAHHNFDPTRSLEGAIICRKISDLLLEGNSAYEDEIRYMERVYNEIYSLSIKFATPHNDTVIVPGRVAYDIYKNINIYACPADRSMREVSYMGFYKGKYIKPEICEILDVQFIDIKSMVGKRVEESDLPDTISNKYKPAWRTAINSAISEYNQNIAEGWSLDAYRVYLLGGQRTCKNIPNSSHKVHMVGGKKGIKHTSPGSYRRGRSYFNLQDLQMAKTTSELDMLRAKRNSRQPPS
ncbi:hypothetical protein ACUIAC_02275 [Dermabacteraceae bacterium P13138]